jgi:hypothetical protein
MGNVTFTVWQRQAIRQLVDPGIGDIAAQIARQTAAESPRDTGLYARSWTVTKGRFPAVRFVSNPVPYGRFVEFGTKHRRANPAFGRTIARWRNRGPGGG